MQIKKYLSKFRVKGEFVVDCESVHIKETSKYLVISDRYRRFQDELMSAIHRPARFDHVRLSPRSNNPY